MMHRASLRIEGMPGISRVIGPEISEDMERSRATITEKGDLAVIEMEAEDTTALRAAISSALRYVAAAASTMNAMNVKEE